MEKNWSWGHSNPETDNPETDRKSDTDTDVRTDGDTALDTDVDTDDTGATANDTATTEAKTDTDTDLDADAGTNPESETDSTVDGSTVGGNADADRVTGEEPAVQDDGSPVTSDEDRLSGAPSGHDEDVHVAGSAADRDEPLVPPAREDDTVTDTTDSYTTDSETTDSAGTDSAGTDSRVTDSETGFGNVHDDVAEPLVVAGHDNTVEPGATAREPAEPAEPAESAEPVEPAEVAGVAAIAQATGDAPGAVKGSGERPPETGDSKGERIEQLMGQDEAAAFRARWREVQSDFVDDPEDAVQRADELASEVLSALVESLNGHKSALDDRWRADKANKSDTERLRQAVRGYRDFFERMLGA